MAKPTLTLTTKEAFLLAFKRAEQTGRTQQIELEANLYARISTQNGRKFLLFQLEGLPTKEQAEALAELIPFQRYKLDWYQGTSLVSLTVQEILEEN